MLKIILRTTTTLPTFAAIWFADDKCQQYKGSQSKSDAIPVAVRPASGVWLVVSGIAHSQPAKHHSQMLNLHTTVRQPADGKVFNNRLSQKTCQITNQPSLKLRLVKQHSAFG